MWRMLDLSLAEGGKSCLMVTHNDILYIPFKREQIQGFFFKMQVLIKPMLYFKLALKK